MLNSESAVEQKRNTRLNSNKSLLDDDSDDEVRQDDRRDSYLYDIP